MPLDQPSRLAPLIPVPLAINEHQAWALAQLCKRIGWAEVRQNAVDDDEAHLMMRTVVSLQMALAKVGFAPR